MRACSRPAPSPTHVLDASSGPARTRRLANPVPDLVPLETAWGWLFGHCGTLAPRRELPAVALGATVAKDVTSSAAVPSFDSSAMDGYAVRASDCLGPSAALVVTGTVMAGEEPGAPVGPGEARRIMTGAAVPPGADAVCPLERATNDGALVCLAGPVRVGDHIRRAGEDVAVGDVAVSARTELAPAHVGLLAAIGCDDVLVHPVPRVGVLSTGDELLADAARGVRDSNRAALLAVLRSDGMPAVDLGLVTDRPEAVVEALSDASADCDAVITTGGVSVGEHDVVRMALPLLPTVARRWLQVAIKPAKPFAFALLRPGASAPRRASIPVFGLPGNPVSAMVSYEVFARPALRKMAGRRHWWRPAIAATAAEPYVRSADGKVHFVPSSVRIDGEGLRASIRPSPRQGAHRLTSLTPANALAVLDDGPGLAAGERVTAWLLDPVAAFAPEPSPPDRRGPEGAPIGRAARWSND